jgi:hypothetical protein
MLVGPSVCSAISRCRARTPRGDPSALPQTFAESFALRPADKAAPVATTRPRPTPGAVGCFSSNPSGGIG